MFKTTTAKGTEGFNISYSDEQSCAKSLEKKLPKDWSIHFEWAQILFADVQYQINDKDKIVRVQYNQSLRHWWPQLEREVLGKIK